MTVVADHTNAVVEELTDQFPVDAIDVSASSFAIAPNDAKITLDTVLTHANSYGFTVKEVDMEQGVVWLSMGT